MNIKEGLTRKIGPLPAWAWGAGVGVIIAVYMFYARRNRATDSPDTTDEFLATSGWPIGAPYTSGVLPGGAGIDNYSLMSEMQALFRTMSEEQREAALEREASWRESQAAMLEQMTGAFGAFGAGLSESIERLQVVTTPVAIPEPQPAPAPAPPPPPSPSPPTPQAPAKPAKGALLWHGASKPNMTTIQKAFGHIGFKVIENTGHKPGSSHRWIVVADY